VPLLIELRRSKCNWLEGTLKRNDDSVAEKALQWTSQTTEIEGDYKEHVEKRSGERNVDSRYQVYSWRKMEATAQDRAGWRQGSNIPTHRTLTRLLSRILYCSTAFCVTFHYLFFVYARVELNSVFYYTLIKSCLIWFDLVIIDKPRERNIEKTFLVGSVHLNTTKGCHKGSGSEAAKLVKNTDYSEDGYLDISPTHWNFQ